MKYTIYDIKTINEQNGGKFFSRGNMKFFKDTLKDFSVIHRDGRVFIRRKAGRIKKDNYNQITFNAPQSAWEFNPDTGALEYSPEMSL